MRVLLGNPKPRNAMEGTDDAPHVTYITIPVSEGQYETEPGANVGAMRGHIAEAVAYKEGVTRMSDLGHGDQEAYLAIAHASGLWTPHAQADPSWVSVADDPVLEAYLAEHFGCPAGLPTDVEDTHYTLLGTKILPPGVSPNAVLGLEALFTTAGRGLFANMMGGGQVGTTGNATSTGATTLTNTGASWATNQWAGYRVYAGGAWGNIISNSSTALTIDQWYAPATPGGSAASTPGGTSTYVIADGGSVSAWFVALTSTNITPAVGDTSLSGELTANGLSRKIAPFAVTSAVSPVSFTLTPVFTYSGTGGTTIYAIGVFVSNVKADTTDSMMFESSLTASATVSTSGDQLTITETITGS